MPNTNSIKAQVEVLTWHTKSKYKQSNSVRNGKIGTGYGRHGRSVLSEGLRIGVFSKKRERPVGHAALKFTLPDTPEVWQQLDSIKEHMDINQSFSYITTKNENGSYVRERVKTIEAYFSWWPSRDGNFNSKQSALDDRDWELGSNHPGRETVNQTLKNSYQNEIDSLHQQLKSTKSTGIELSDQLFEVLAIEKTLTTQQLQNKDSSSTEVQTSNLLLDTVQLKLEIETQIDEYLEQITEMRDQIKRLEYLRDSASNTIGLEPSRTTRLPLSLDGNDDLALNFPAMIQQVQTFYTNGTYSLLTTNSNGRQGENCSSTVMEIVSAGITDELRNENVREGKIVKRKSLGQNPHLIATPTASQHQAQLVKKVIDTVKYRRHMQENRNKDNNTENTENTLST